MAFLVEDVECALSSLTNDQKLGSRGSGAVRLKRQRCCHGWWEEAVGSSSSAVCCTSPSMLYFTSLPYLSFMYLRMSSEGMSDTARLYFLFLLLALPTLGL